MDPSDHDKNEIGNGVPDATDGPEHANGRLGENDWWLRSVVEHSAEIVTIVDPDGTLRYANPAWQRTLGYDPAESIGTMNVLDHVHPDDLAHVLEETEEALTEGGITTNEAEYRFRRKDGSWRWMESVGTYLLDDPEVEGVVVVSRDVTERKAAEQALREAERHFRLLAQNASDVVTLVGATGTIRYQSPSAERVLGYRPEEMIGGNCFDYVHPDDLERVEMAFAEGLVDPARRPSAEYRFRHKDGSWVWVEAVGANLLGDREVGAYVVSSRDVTEHKETEIRLRETEARYRTLVEQIPAVTYVEEEGDAHSTLYISPQIEGMLGYPQEEWLGGLGQWEGCIHPEDRERVLSENARSDRTGEPFKTEYRMIHRDGRAVWVHDEAVLVQGPDGGRFWQGVITDVTDRKALEARLEHQALHDPLTGLPNRQLLLDRLGQALRRTRRRTDHRVAVLFMDLDNFKRINDSMGHEAGDLLLTVVAQRLRRSLRPVDTLVRFGGDEFVVLIEDVAEPLDAVRLAERITGAFGDPFVVEGRELYVSASIGIAFSDDRTRDADDLLRDADTAMYRAKEEVAAYRVFDPAMYLRAVGRLELENDLRRAVAQGEFVLHYQPIVRLADGRVWGVEALVRWDHPERGLLNPGEFMDLAEGSGLVIPMGERVLEEACRQAKEWQEGNPDNPPLVVSVNLSAKQLGRADLAETVAAALEKTRFDGQCLVLDVTETAYVDQLEGNAAVLDRLAAMGVRISIDDFGTGYSSLSYLKHLPADAIKIDKSFVVGLPEEAEDAAIVRLIIELAHTLGMEVIAEGVETQSQAALLEEMGCDMAQGYRFAEPLPAERVSAVLT